MNCCYLSRLFLLFAVLSLRYSFWLSRWWQFLLFSPFHWYLLFVSLPNAVSFFHLPIVLSRFKVYSFQQLFYTFAIIILYIDSFFSGNRLYSCSLDKNIYCTSLFLWGRFFNVFVRFEFSLHIQSLLCIYISS